MNTELEEEPRLKRKPTTSSARPRRLSEVDIHDSKKPIPDATSFFIFSKTNRLGNLGRLKMSFNRFELDVIFVFLFDFVFDGNCFRVSVAIGDKRSIFIIVAFHLSLKFNIFSCYFTSIMYFINIL